MERRRRLFARDSLVTNASHVRSSATLIARIAAVVTEFGTGLGCCATPGFMPSHRTPPATNNPASIRRMINSIAQPIGFLVLCRDDRREATCPLRRVKTVYEILVRRAEGSCT